MVLSLMSYVQRPDGNSSQLGMKSPQKCLLFTEQYNTSYTTVLGVRASGTGRYLSRGKNIINPLRRSILFQ